MKDFLKKWILLIIAALILAVFIAYWILKPVDDVIGAFLVSFFVGFPLIAIFTTLWICLNSSSRYRFFSPLLLIPFDYIWLLIFGDIKAVLKDPEFLLLFLPTVLPAALAALICYIVERRKRRKD